MANFADFVINFVINFVIIDFVIMDFVIHFVINFVIQILSIFGKEQELIPNGKENLGTLLLDPKRKLVHAIQ